MSSFISNTKQAELICAIRSHDSGHLRDRGSPLGMVQSSGHIWQCLETYLGLLHWG